MALPKFIGTGDPQVDAQTIQANKSQSSYVAKVVIRGWSGPVIKSVPHLLGRTPTRFNVVRQRLTTGATGNVVETSDGVWSNNSVDLEFPGDGDYDVELSG
jgi:hypothetical protein